MRLCFKVDLSFILFVFVSLFTKQITYLSIIVISIILHELSHILVYYLFTKEKDNKSNQIDNLFICEINITALGGIIYLDLYQLSRLEKIIFYLAGIITNFIIVIVSICIINVKDNNIIQMIINFNIVMILFNIIPIYPLDGYHIIKEITDLRWMSIISIISLIMYIIISFYYQSLALKFIAIYLVIKNIMKRRNEKNELNYLNIRCMVDKYKSLENPLLDIV